MDAPLNPPPTHNDSTVDVTTPNGATSATSRTVQALRSMILTGELKPGEKLKVDRLRQQLQVGASPIREALSLLTSAHLVERIDQRGFRAATVSEDGFRELLKTRCWVEERALRESIAHGDARWAEGVFEAHEQLAQTLRQETDALVADDAWESQHHRFHQALIAGCGSSLLRRFCDELYDHNIRYRHLAGRSERYQERDLDAEHAALAKAALDRDAEMAVRLLLTHYQLTGTFLTGLPSSVSEQV